MALDTEDAQILCGHRSVLSAASPSPSNGDQQGNSEQVTLDDTGSSAIPSFSHFQWQWDGGRSFTGDNFVPTELHLPLNPDLDERLRNFTFSEGDLARIVGTLEMTVDVIISNERSNLIPLDAALRNLPNHRSLDSTSLAPEHGGDVIFPDY